MNMHISGQLLKLQQYQRLKECPFCFARYINTQLYPMKNGDFGLDPLSREVNIITTLKKKNISEEFQGIHWGACCTE